LLFGLATFCFFLPSLTISFSTAIFPAFDVFKLLRFSGFFLATVFILLSVLAVSLSLLLVFLLASEIKRYS